MIENLIKHTHTHTYIDFEGKGIIDANKSIIGT
jgi:hypothetical protein